MRRVALITGAAGGIGQAICERFHEAGWKTIGLDIVEQTPAHVDDYTQLDLTDCDAIEAAMRSLGPSAGSIHALIHNAACQVERPLMNTTIAQWDAVMNTNVRGPFWLTRCAVPYMRHCDASVVNIASVHARATSRGLAAYVTSKGALTAFTRAAALELAGDGIRVNALLPGAVDTAMLDRGLARGNENDSEMARERLASKHALKRVGTPGEVAEGVLFLADTTRSSFMTGQSLVIDGGALAQLSTE